MMIELPCVNVLSKMDLLQTTTGFGGSNNTGGEAGKNDDDDDSGGYGGGGYDDDGCDDTTSPLPFNLEFFTQCHDLRRLVDYLDSNPMDFATGDSNGVDADPSFDYTEDLDYVRARERTRSSNFHIKYRKLHHELCDMVEDFSLLSFLPLSIQDAESVGRVVARVDKCNGYVFLNNNRNNNDDEDDDCTQSRTGGGNNNSNNMRSMFSSAIVADSEWAAGVLSDVQEKYLGDVMFKENISELNEPRDRIEKTKGGI